MPYDMIVLLVYSREIQMDQLIKYQGSFCVYAQLVRDDITL